jgi:unsaturated rhamnogalacturonyl hydrolase
MLKALRLRYIRSEEYRESAVRAGKAVLANINALGELTDVSSGTVMGHMFQHYKDIERTIWLFGGGEGGGGGGLIWGGVNFFMK